MLLLSIRRRWLGIDCFGALSLLPLVCPADATLTPQPLAKLGSCPSGYTASGQYCNPGPKARVALEKRGQCPSGYTTSGAYCLAGQQARPAVPKRGASCPSGWSASGAYCLRKRP
ncbi:hypothetical protein [uncultured Thiocystis sp.]|jgi:hypothetical protein|uniref:hypothetical protein n=1 Tax=uncultured Thiocystis sp. TaxID=1202134 RepID=UPI0025DC7979|nr:hypothetical protein [uncultured Thiocystis sp.]